MMLTEKKPSPEIRGNSLRIYLHLLGNGPSELREIQRSLGISSPSLVSYHVEKLIGGCYVSQNERGQYFALKDRAGEVLQGFTKVGAVLIPQLLFLTVLFTPIVGYFAWMSTSNPSFVPFLSVAAVALVGVLWYEVFKVWRRLTALK